MKKVRLGTPNRKSHYQKVMIVHGKSDRYENEIYKNFNKVMRKNLKISKEKNIPLVKFDPVRKKVYLQYYDGSKKYIENGGDI